MDDTIVLFYFKLLILLLAEENVIPWIPLFYFTMHFVAFFRYHHARKMKYHSGNRKGTLNFEQIKKAGEIAVLNYSLYIS